MAIISFFIVSWVSCMKDRSNSSAWPSKLLPKRALSQRKVKTASCICLRAHSLGRESFAYNIYISLHTNNTFHRDTQGRLVLQVGQSNWPNFGTLQVRLNLAQHPNCFGNGFFRHNIPGKRELGHIWTKKFQTWTVDHKYGPITRKTHIVKNSNCARLFLARLGASSPFLFSPGSLPVFLTLSPLFRLLGVSVLGVPAEAGLDGKAGPPGAATVSCFN